MPKSRQTVNTLDDPKDKKPRGNHLWKPGQSGNPGGRAKGLERRVRELVDFDAIILATQDIALGRLPPGMSGETTVKIRDRNDAAKILFDRGFGKAKQTVELAHDITQNGLKDPDTLDDAALAILDEAVDRAFMGGKVIDTRAVEVPDVRDPDEDDEGNSAP